MGLPTHIFWIEPSILNILMRCSSLELMHNRLLHGGHQHDDNCHITLSFW